MVRRLLTRSAAAGVAVLGAEFAYAVLRPSPQLEDFDPSGRFGSPADPLLRVALVGDSTVTGPGVGSPDDLWARITALRIAESGYQVELESFAVSGARVSDAIAGQMEAVVEWNPDVIMVWIGANDLLKGGTTTEFKKELDQLIDGLTGANAMIVMSGIGDLGTIPRFVPPLRSFITHRAQRFDSIHKEIAAEYGAYVFEQRIDSRKIWLEDKDLWASDHFHMSAKGHARSADILWVTLEPLLPGLNAAV